MYTSSQNRSSHKKKLTKPSLKQLCAKITKKKKKKTPDIVAHAVAALGCITIIRALCDWNFGEKGMPPVQLKAKVQLGEVLGHCSNSVARDSLAREAFNTPLTRVGLKREEEDTANAKLNN